MHANREREALHISAALADPERLIILGQLCHAELRLEELAQRTALSETVIRSHLHRLREAGLVQLRMIDRQQVYHVNRLRIQKFARQIEDLLAAPVAIQPKPDSSWVDALDLPDADKKVLRHYVSNNHISEIPAKQDKFWALLRWVVLRFEAGRTYTEGDVNAILMALHPDYATLRRGLIDYRLLDRARDGSTYWRPVPKS